MKKKLGLLFSTVVLALGLVGCGGGGDTSSSPATNDADPAKEAKVEAKTMRAGIGLNDQHPQFKGLEKFKEIVEDKTNGEIVVELYHSGQLGDDRTMIEALQLGSQEITVPSTAVIANFVPEFAVFDIPFLFPNEQVADAVLGGEVGEGLLEKLDSQNLVGLGYWENGFRDLTNSRRAVATAEDFKGLKIRTMENQLHLEAFRALGANPTPMAFTELFAAMQQGTVDGQENPYSTIYLQKFFEVQKHVSNTHHIYSPWAFLVSKSFFDGLTPEQQEIVTEAAYEAGAFQREMNREASAEYLANLQAEGMTYTEITPEARQEMVDKVKPVVEQFADQIGRDVVDAVYEAIEAAQ